MTKTKKKPTIISLSFKDNVMDKMLLEWLEQQGEIVGKSSYLKNLIKKDMDEQNNQ